MSGIEGAISIDVNAYNSPLPEIKIHSTRPVYAAKMLIGKSPEQVLSIVPLLFNICGIAQARASLSAIEQAQNIIFDADKESARDLLVLAENAKEHLLRICLDWPNLFQQKPNHQSLPYITQLLAQFKQVLFKNGQAFDLSVEPHADIDQIELTIQELEQYLSEQIFHMPISQWLELENIDQLQCWSRQQTGIAAYSVQYICQQGWKDQGVAACYPLPSLNKQQLMQSFLASNADDFIAQPQWQARCYETTSYTRQAEHPLIKSLYQNFQAGLISRWVARLIELASIPQQMRNLLYQENIMPDKDSINEDSQGIAAVEAARGRLIHRVELNNNRIKNYQILAPTEWNFHPIGLIYDSLSHINADDAEQWQQLARLMINTIDPCVGYQLRIH